MARLRRAFETLHELCETAEARRSLAGFRLRFAAVMGREVGELGCGGGGVGGVICLDGPGVGGGEVGVGGVGGMSESRKLSFMDRLLGRQGKRRSHVIG